MNERARLDNRRPNLTISVTYRDFLISVTFGFDIHKGQINEVFGSAEKPTTDLDFMTADACIAISITLQMGITPEELLHSMSQVPVVGVEGVTTEPGSLIGKIVEAIINEENRMGLTR